MITPYYEDEAVTIYNADCRDVMPTLGPVGLVLTDPPYGMGVISRPLGSGESKTLERRPIADWDMDFDPTAIEWGEVPIVAFTLDWRIPQWYQVRPEGRLMAWVKTNPTPSFRRQVINAAEWIFFDAEVEYTSYEHSQTALHGPHEVTLNTTHPTRKPAWLMEHLVRMFKGDTILDPFMGSGTTLRAAKDLGRKAIGIEIEEKYCEIAAQRMSQMVMEMQV